MQDLPTSNEIVSVVSDFLRDHVMPQLEGRSKFHALVAANALDIVARELASAPVEDAKEKARLNTLLNKDAPLEELNRTLGEALRGGTMDLNTPGLKEHLWKTTLTKLAVDQPKYSAFQKAKSEGRI